MATAGKYDIRIDQGATYSESFRIEDDDVGRNLTGYTVNLKAAADLDDATLVIDLNTDSEISIDAGQGTPSTAGWFTITIAATVTAAYTFTQLRYSLTVTSVAGVVERILEGGLSLSKGVIGS